MGRMHFQPLAMLLLWLFWGMLGVAGQPSLQDERAILQEFYQSTGGDFWTTNRNWNSATIGVCEWHGMTCDAAGNVIELTMVQNNVTGSIPPSLYGLPHLERAVFVLSNITDAGLGGVNRSSTLQGLSFIDTMLTSLDGIAQAPSTLTGIFMVRNPLHGPFPTEVTELVDLEVLELTESGLTGTLPTEIGEMKSLQLLDLSGNDLTGTLPSELGNLTNLVTAILDDNAFSGTLPAEINNMTELATLHIANNQLTGKLLNFSMTPNLGHIILAGNQLTGTIPSDLWNEENNTFGFRILDLTYNFLSGSIPLDLTRFEFLDIEVTGNFLTNLDSEWCLEGEVNGFEVEQFGCDAILCPPGTFAVAGRHTASGGPCKPCENAIYYGSNTCNQTLTVLAALYYQTNGPSWISREGWSELDVFDSVSDIDPSLFNVCTWYGVTCHTNSMTVQSINLGGNNLTGPVPPELFIIPDLESLSLSTNAVDIDFSSGFTPTLTSLRLDSVGIASLALLHLATSLRHLDLRCNGIGGTLLETLNVLSSLINLESLDLTNNQLKGPLHLASFGGFPLLETLLLGSNKLTGSLPSFQDNAFLTTLDLSGNALEGTIPSNFLASVMPNETMVVVDLSENRLAGAIPATLDRFETMTLDLVDNRIEAVPVALCNNAAWNQGAVGRYGCTGLLCPPQTYGGRQTGEDEPCFVCTEVVHYGQTSCPSLLSFRTSPLRPFSRLRPTYCPLPSS